MLLNMVAVRQDQCDGYAAYPSFARQHPKPIQLAGCWTHVRRKFHEVREQTPRVTGWFLRQIQLLYQVEAALREKKAGPKLRAAVRAGTSRWVELAADWLQPIYREIKSGAMSGCYVQIDETPVDYLDPGRDKTSQGYLWTCAKPAVAVVFHWDQAVPGPQCC